MRQVYDTHTIHVNASHTRTLAAGYLAAMAKKLAAKAKVKTKKARDPEKVQFGSRLKAARLLTEEKYVQADVAKRLGVETGTVSGWETGYNYPDPLMLGRLAKLYSTTADLLIWDDTISMDAIQMAVQYDALNDDQRRAFKGMWMGYFQATAPDGDKQVVRSEPPKPKHDEMRAKRPAKPDDQEKPGGEGSQSL